MPPSDVKASGPPDDFGNRNLFLDCLLGVIGLCERTVSALADQGVDLPPAAPQTKGTADGPPPGPMLR